MFDTDPSSLFRSSRLPPGDNESRIQPSTDPLAFRSFQYCNRLSNACFAALPAKMIYQSARYQICVRLIANYTLWMESFAREPTLTTLQDMVAVSRRQVSTFVAALRQRKLVDVCRADGVRRSFVLRPTSTLISEVGRGPLTAACCFMGDGLWSDGAIDALPPDDVARFLTRAVCDRVLEIDPRVFPVLSSIASHDCGYLMLVALMQHEYLRVSASSLPLWIPSYAALARRFGVSKSHAANVIRRGRAYGWFVVSENGTDIRMGIETTAEFERYIEGRIGALGPLAQSIFRASPNASGT